MAENNVNVAALPPSLSSKDKKKSAARAPSSPSAVGNARVPGPSSLSSRYGRTSLPPRATSSSSEGNTGHSSAPSPRYGRPPTGTLQSVSRPVDPRVVPSSSMGNTPVPSPLSAPSPRDSGPRTGTSSQSVSRPVDPRVVPSSSMGNAPVPGPSLSSRYGHTRLPPRATSSSSVRPRYGRVAPSSSSMGNAPPSSVSAPTGTSLQSVSRPVDPRVVPSSSMGNAPVPGPSSFPPPLSVGGSPPAVGPSPPLQPSLDRGITAVLKLESHKDYVGFEKGAIVRYYGRSRRHYMKDFVVVCSQGGEDDENPQYKLERLDKKGEFFHPRQNTLVLIRNPE